MCVLPVFTADGNIVVPWKYKDVIPDGILVTAWKNENVSSLLTSLHALAADIPNFTGMTFSAMTNCPLTTYTCLSLIDFRLLQTEWMGGTVLAPPSNASTKK